MGLLYDLLFFYGIYIIESYVGNKIMLLPRYGVNLGSGVTDTERESARFVRQKPPLHYQRDSCRYSRSNFSAIPAS